jgi:phosphatidylglycerol:prolipoprotein diacylglycerol transferase
MFFSFTLTLSPVAFSIGGVSVYWYGLCYILGFVSVWLVLRQTFHPQKTIWHHIESGIFWGFVGGLIGGRVGYALLYDISLLTHPLDLISAWNASGEYVGISGMSFHGAIVGASVSVWVFTRKKDISFFRFADSVVWAIPLALFWGRIGNFLGGELFGRPTSLWWGVDFGDGISRHPSQLYESFFEGMVLFGILVFARSRIEREGGMFMLFLGGYATLRFFVEFFREPDVHIGFVAMGLTMGQFLSLMVLSGVLLTRRLNLLRVSQKF